ncbi:MAG: glycosyltransferase family 4 protein [Terriglobales bacterium]|jgi:glycosyltransferase involved in cell wall biosynthesis
MITVFTPSFADESNTNAQNLTVKEIVARLDPSRYRVIMLGAGTADERIAKRANTEILRWRNHWNTARILTQLLARSPDVYFFPREGPLDAAFLTARTRLRLRTALVTYVVSGGLETEPQDGRPVLRRAIRECDSIAGNSRHMTEIIRKIGGTNVQGKNVHTVYDGIDRRYYYSNSGSQIALRPKRVLFAGSFRKYKRADLVVEQAARFPEWESRLAGKGEEEAACRKQAQNANCRNVQFLGHLNAAQLGEEFRQAQIFFFPSEVEGHPQVLGQAAACGLPCIGRSSYQPDYVIDGVTGLLAGSDAELSAALGRLIQDAALRNRMSAAAIRHSEKFNWDEIAAQWAAIMEEAIVHRQMFNRRRSTPPPHIVAESVPIKDSRAGSHHLPDRKRRVLILSEIISPYRIPVFNALAQHEAVDLHVVFLSETDAGLRQWRVYRDEIHFSYEVLPSHRLRAGKRSMLLNWGLRSRLAEFAPEILICGGYNYVASWEAQSWARRHDARFILWSESNAHDARSKLAWLQSMKDYFLSRCDRFVVPGKASCEYLQSLGSAPELITVAPNAVNNRWFAAQAESVRAGAAEFRERYHLPQRFILFVGRLVPEKGVFDLLDAYGRLGDDRRRDVGLVFAGDGASRPELERKARRISPGEVYFPGFLHREDLAGFYAFADALILPTHSDPWGLVVNEAMACGLPVIATVVAGCSADLVEDEWNGYVVPPNDPERLKLAIERILESSALRQQMGARSAERIRSYSPEACAAALATAALVAERCAQ